MHKVKPLAPQCFSSSCNDAFSKLKVLEHTYLFIVLREYLLKSSTLTARDCFPFVSLWEMLILCPPGDSFTVGLANVGNASTCIPSTADCSEGNFNCHQLPVETEDASLSWGPLTAANFTADYQVIAWSGAALARESGDHSNLPQEVAQELTPSDIELFGRQVAGNRSRRVGNFSAWVPQVCSFLVMYFVHFLAFCSGGLFCILASLPM